MDFDYAPEDVAFREELRDWLARNLEPGLDHRAWHRRLVAGRWVVPDWPARWGGRDATLMQQVVYQYYKRTLSLQQAFGGSAEFEEEYARLLLDGKEP